MSTPALPWDLVLATKDGRRVVIRESSTLDYCKKSATTIAPGHPDVIAEGANPVLECVLRVSATVVAAPPPAPVTPAPPPAPTGWVMGTALVSDPKAALPVKGVAFKEPSFGTTIYRVSEKGEPPSGFGRNDYSRRQAFNANNTRQIVAALDGAWHTYNAVTFAYEKKLAGLAGDAEPQWHPTNPDLLYFIPTQGIGMKLYELNVVTNTSRQVADFGPRLKARWPTAMACWTGSEGSPSADGRYWCFMVDGDGWKSVGVICWDMQTDSIIGWRDTKGERPDHVSMSPSGRWCVVSHVDATNGTTAWTHDFKSSKKMLAASQHSDLALTAEGHDAYVAVDYGANDGDVFMFDIDTGVRTKLFASYIGGNASAFHFSGKAFAKPGWVLVSAQEHDPAKAKGWPYGKIFWHELKAGGRVANVAFHESAAGYYKAPVATTSRDGTRIAFNSSSHSTADTDIHVYQARTPALP